MARLAMSGWELQSITVGTEFGISGAPTIDTTVFRSGLASGKISSLTSGVEMSFQKTFTAADNAGPFYARVFLRITTFPSGNNDIIGLYNSAGTLTASIALTSTGTLRLQNGATTLVGSASNPLSTGQWYEISLLFNNAGGAGAGVLTARIDGTQFASSSTLTFTNSIAKMRTGGNLNVETQTTGIWNFDDWAMNDGTGASENSYPPSNAKIIHLQPNAAGDVNTFATQTGGTAGSANNFTRVKEIIPDDATTFNGSNTLNQEDLYKCVASGLKLNDIVVAVQVGTRFRNSVADATTAIKFEIEKAASGTISQSGTIIPNTTSWNSNQTAQPFNPQITLYNDPNGTAWTQATLDTMQIGQKITTGGTNRIDVSTVYAIVEYIHPTGLLSVLGAGG